MAAEIQDIISNLNKPVVVIEAAILLVAGWQHKCHEVIILYTTIK